MRYIGSGFIDLDNAYLFDSSDFEIQSYYLFLDYTNQYQDLEGDITNIDFTYTDWNYLSDYSADLYLDSSIMFTYFKTFEDFRDFSIGSHSTTERNLKISVMQFIEKINYYNQKVVKYDQYDHGANYLFPFAEFVVIKRGGYIIDTKLIKILEKSYDTSLEQTLRNQYFMSKFLIHYSTSGTDYNSIYVKSLYNRKDYETINKPSTVISTKLYQEIHSDSSKLYFDMSISGLVTNATDTYNFYDLSNNDLIYINNTHLCRVYDFTDSTVADGTQYRITSTYRIEFLEFDNTTDLDDFMGSAIYYDFTLSLLKYYVNIRLIKKLNGDNELFTDTVDFYEKRLSIKTFYTPNNAPSDSKKSNQQEFFVSGFLSEPILYSGVYDLTNNMRTGLLPLLNSFSSEEYDLPVDVTVDKTTISNGSLFTIDVFVDNTDDVNTFVTHINNFGMYILREGSTSDVIVAKLFSATQVDSNTIRIKLGTILYDDVWFLDLTDSYQSIPSDSKIILYRFHIYNIIPYIKLGSITFNNNINNLIDIHCFSYSMNNLTTMKQNGSDIVV